MEAHQRIEKEEGMTILPKAALTGIQNHGELASQRARSMTSLGSRSSSRAKIFGHVS